MLHAILSSKICDVLEIGSGAGAFSRLLLRIYPLANVVGTDYLDKMVKISKRVILGDDNENGSATTRFRPHPIERPKSEEERNPV
jgi:trans-aconitate methyltransferase